MKLNPPSFWQNNIFIYRSTGFRARYALVCFFFVNLIVVFPESGSTLAQSSFKISLHKQQLTPKATDMYRDADFYIARVVDARPLKNHIGIVQRGMVNTKVPADLEGGLEKQLLGFFTRSQLPNRGTAIVLKVHQLSINEQTSFTSETATAAVAMDFLVQRNDSLLVVYQASAFVKRGGMDVTALHDNNIAAALSECIEKFGTSNWRETLSRATLLNPDQLNTPLAELTERPDFPIATAATPERGIYRSFTEFRSNLPGVLQPFVTESKPRRGRDWDGVQKVTPYFTLPNGTRNEVKKIWGFSDGDQVYIYFQKDYFPLRLEGNHYVFDAYAPPDGATMATAGVMGGLVGGAIAGAAMANRRQTYQLDMFNGQVTEWDGNNYPRHIASPGTAQGSARITIYCRSSKKMEGPARILFYNKSDTVSVELGEDSSVQINWDNLLSEVNVCVAGKSNPCYHFLPDVAKPNYLEYIAPARSGNGAPANADDELVIRPVKEQEALFYLKQIRYAQEKAGKKQK